MLKKGGFHKLENIFQIVFADGKADREDGNLPFDAISVLSPGGCGECWIDAATRNGNLPPPKKRKSGVSVSHTVFDSHATGVSASSLVVWVGRVLRLSVCWLVGVCGQGYIPN